MVFVSRAERKFEELARYDVGPGSYNLGQKNQVNQGFAPFASTTNRVLFQDSNYAPGPGSYELLKERKNKQSSQSPKKHSPRFNNQSKFESPGPGAYSSPDQWKSKNKILRTFTSNSCNRLPSAPSIPANHQSYGYDENAEGDLIMHTVPDETHTGLAQDSVGPGHYSIKRTNKSGVCWFRSKSKRNLYGSNQTGPEVGPGSYNESISISPLYKFKQSAVFLSKYKDEHLETELPGPGYYNLSKSIKPKRLPTRFQNFGSSSIRFSRKADQRDLGPGSYSLSSLKTVKPGKTPFASSNTRFKYRNSETPGPGSYEAKINDTSTITVKSTIGAKVKEGKGFGSSGKRFKDKSLKATPGPGDYAEGRFESYLDYKQSAVFASKSKRWNMQ